MGRLRVAIVGCGWVSGSHMEEGYKQLPDAFDVLACCDRDRERAETFGRTHDVPRRVASVADVLAMPDIDVVDICTPPMLHADMVEATLRAGKHAICEKPFAESLARLDAIAQLEAASPGRVMPIFQYRFGTEATRVRHAITSGLCGRAFVSSVETMWLRGSDYYEVQWRGKFASELGGVLLTQSIHMHDLLLWLLGPAARVSAFKSTRVNPIEVEDCAAVALVMADGSLATLTATLGSVQQITRFRLVFENCTWECLAEGAGNVGNPGAAAWRLWPKTHEIGVAIEAAMSEVRPVRSRFAGQFESFSQAIETGAAFAVTLDDARRSLELITAAFHSHAAGIAVPLPVGADHPLYRGWTPSP
ncbi:MAG: Gfo/Idh/MocA family oxidoreductase [Acidisphaera sp.]|nr:Gfo/Idh/MocA family oxidoreductase [Acidisphaera sp.]